MLTHHIADTHHMLALLIKSQFYQVHPITCQCHGVCCWCSDFHSDDWMPRSVYQLWRLSFMFATCHNNKAFRDFLFGTIAQIPTDCFSFLQLYTYFVPSTFTQWSTEVQEPACFGFWTFMTIHVNLCFALCSSEFGWDYVANELATSTLLVLCRSLSSQSLSREVYLLCALWNEALFQSLNVFCASKIFILLTK